MKTAKTTSAALAPAQEKQFAEMGEQLTTVYERAALGMRDIVIFGAMVAKIQKVVSTCGHNSTRGPQTKGEGLKAWLATYAPTVPRARAYEYKNIADGIAKAFGLGVKTDLAELLQAEPKALPDSQRKKQSAILDAIRGQSRRQLLLNFGGVEIPADEQKPRGGKRTPAGGDYDPTKDPEDVKAMDEWAPILRGLAYGLESGSWKHLPQTGDVSLRTLKDLVLDLNQRLTAAGLR